MATLAQLRLKVQSKLGLDRTASSTEEGQLDAWINEGIIDVLERTHCHVNCTSPTLSNGVYDYDLDTDILAVLDIQYTAASSGTSSRLKRVTVQEILDMRSSGSSDGVVRYYAVAGHDKLLVYPTPTGADTLKMYYVPRPTALSISSQDPSSETLGGIPTEYHKAIELFALAEGADFTDHQPSKYGATYRDEYERWIIRIRKSLRNKGGRSLGAARVGRRPFVAHDESADWYV